MRKIKVIRQIELNQITVNNALGVLAEKLKAMPVKLVFLFGSHARKLRYGGKINSFSDVDIGVLLEEESLEYRLNIMLDLIGIFTEVLNREDIDLTILNDAGVRMRYNMLEEGILLYKRDIQDLKDYKYRTRKYFFDIEPKLKQYQDLRVAKVKERSKDG